MPLPACSIDICKAMSTEWQEVRQRCVFPPNAQPPYKITILTVFEVTEIEVGLFQRSMRYNLLASASASIHSCPRANLRFYPYCIALYSHTELTIAGVKRRGTGRWVLPRRRRRRRLVGARARRAATGSCSRCTSAWRCSSECPSSRTTGSGARWGSRGAQCRASSAPAPSSCSPAATPSSPSRSTISGRVCAHWRDAYVLTLSSLNISIERITGTIHGNRFSRILSTTYPYSLTRTRFGCD